MDESTHIRNVLDYLRRRVSHAFPWSYSFLDTGVSVFMLSWTSDLSQYEAEFMLGSGQTAGRVGG